MISTIGDTSDPGLVTRNAPRFPLPWDRGASIFILREDPHRHLPSIARGSTVMKCADEYDGRRNAEWLNP